MNATQGETIKMNRKIRHTVIAMALIAAPIISRSATLADATPVFKAGNWTVLRLIDSMNDSVVCTGIYKSNYEIQLSPETLYIKVRGGVAALRIRYDEGPPAPLRLAERIEKELGSVMINSSSVAMHSRLRMEVSTLVNGVASEDINLTGYSEALANIGQKCPVPAQPVSSSPGGVAAPPVTAPQCSESLIAKMKVQRVTDSQIDAICR